MNKLAIVLSDLHYPYHSKKYISIATQLIRDLKPDYVIQVGDALDAAGISTYLQDPNKESRLIDEIKAYSEQLDAWQRIMKNGSEFHQLQGNHCRRLDKIISKDCRAIHELVKTIPELLNFKERNKENKVKFIWHKYSDWDSCKIHDVIIHHGVYFDTNLAVSNLKRYPGIKYVQGHSHRYQHAAAGGVWSVSLGHGSDASKTAHIAAPNTWQQAIGVITFVDRRGHFEPLIVNNGLGVFRGELYKG